MHDAVDTAYKAFGRVMDRIFLLLFGFVLWLAPSFCLGREDIGYR